MNTPIQDQEQQPGMLQITVDGKGIELVPDEYNNYYLKQELPNGGVIYIPYTFEMQEEEIPRMYETKY